MFRIRRIGTKPKTGLILFISGAIVCIMLDLIGVTSITTESVFNTPIECSVPSFIILPAVYILLGIIIGLTAKNPYNAAFYGACIGQCQMLFPIIAFLVLHTGHGFDVLWRSICGLPLSTSFSGIAFWLRKLISKK